MLGQSNKKIKSRRVPQRLRRSLTQAERTLWSALRLQQLRGFKFRRQHLLGNYVLDFVCMSARLVIEVDGGQHAEAGAADERRTRFLMNAGFRVLRFWNNEVLAQTEAVLMCIAEELERGAETPSPPPPSP
jgi:very-short-patch-repair endonuclease